MKTPIESAAQILAPLGATYASGTLALDLAPLAAWLHASPNPHGKTVVSARSLGAEIIYTHVPADADGPQVASAILDSLIGGLMGDEEHEGLATQAETLLSLIPPANEVARDAMREIIGQCLAWEYRARELAYSLASHPLQRMQEAFRAAGLRCHIEKHEWLEIQIWEDQTEDDPFFSFMLEDGAWIGGLVLPDGEDCGDDGCCTIEVTASTAADCKRLAGHMEACLVGYNIEAEETHSALQTIANA